MTILFVFQQHQLMHAPASTWSIQHSSTAAAQNSQLHFSWPMAPTGQSWTQLITWFWESTTAWISVAGQQNWRIQAATGWTVEKTVIQHISEKMQFSCFSVLPGSGEALLRWSGKNKSLFDCLLSLWHSCQTLSTSVDVGRSYIKPKQCHFLRQCSRCMHFVAIGNKHQSFVTLVAAVEIL